MQPTTPPAVSELSEMQARAPHLDFTLAKLRAQNDQIPAVREARKARPKWRCRRAEDPAHA